MPDTEVVPTDFRRHQLRCKICARADDCSPTELFRYSRDGWPVCCAEVMSLHTGIDPVIADPPSGRDKRLGRRRAAKSGARIEIRKGTLGVGPDLGMGLVDLSEDGLCIRLKVRIEPGGEVEIGLGRPGGGKLLKLIGTVLWCRGDVGGTLLAGVRLRRRLSHAELADLAR